MANGDGWGGAWHSQEREMFDNALEQLTEDMHGDSTLADIIAGDDWAHFLYHEALFDMSLAPEQRPYEAFVIYMKDEYDIEFEDVFDWDDYRSWYENR